MELIMQADPHACPLSLESLVPNFMDTWTEKHPLF